MNKPTPPGKTAARKIPAPVQTRSGGRRLSAASSATALQHKSLQQKRKHTDEDYLDEVPARNRKRLSTSGLADKAEQYERPSDKAKGPLKEPTTSKHKKKANTMTPPQKTTGTTQAATPAGTPPEGLIPNPGSEEAAESGEPTLGKIMECINLLTSNMIEVKAMMGKYDDKLSALDTRVGNFEDKVERGLASQRTAIIKEVKTAVAAESEVLKEDITKAVTEKVELTLTHETSAIKLEMQQLRRRQDMLENSQDPGPRPRWSGQRPQPSQQSQPHQQQQQQQEQQRPEKYQSATCVEKYWNARKCIKFSPIPNGDLKAGAMEFILNKLLVEEDDIDASDIIDARRVRGRSGGSPTLECLVTFKDVETRDMVCSYARNLGDQRVGEGQQRSNIRMEIPAHLMDTFRLLDRHGHLLKEKYGKDLRRHVRYDDDTLSLYLDVKRSSKDQWRRITPETARRERNTRDRASSSGRARSLSTLDGGSDEDGGGGTGGGAGEEEESDDNDTM